MLSSWFTLLAFVAGALCALWSSRVIGSAVRSQKSRRRAQRAIAAEKGTPQLLAALGYTVEATQETLDWALTVDDCEHRIELRCDLLARKDGRLYVVEVKTGAAADPTATGTRRQLLEYLLAYEADGVLLANTEQQIVQRVEFPFASAKRENSSIGMRHIATTALLCFALGALVARLTL